MSNGHDRVRYHNGVISGTATSCCREAYLHQKYLVEVHPEGEAAFRVELKAWVRRLHGRL
jgi:hypothetical protein